MRACLEMSGTVASRSSPEMAGTGAFRAGSIFMAMVPPVAIIATTGCCGRCCWAAAGGAAAGAAAWAKAGAAGAVASQTRPASRTATLRLFDMDALPPRACANGRPILPWGGPSGTRRFSRLDRNRLGLRDDGAGEAELADLAREGFSLRLGRAPVEVVGPEVVPEGAVAQHVPSGGEDRSGDGADGLFRSAALAQPLELRPEVAVLLAAGGP